MSVRKDTIFEQFISPIVGWFVDEEETKQLRDRIDWETTCDRLRNDTLSYPDYYRQSNFHGIEGGYLTIDAAVTYDPITRYAVPPNETWVRQEALKQIGGSPRRILDLGCGTGSMTVMLQQAFPQAEVIGMDLSPYMLAVAEDKAKNAQTNIQWMHGNAEATGFDDNSFDLVTAALLFHETPPEVSRQILREAWRILQGNGEMLVLDGNQETLRELDWLRNVFEEPYIEAYANGNLDAWMGAADFDAIRTEEVWWVHQVTRGIKPIPGQSPDYARSQPITVEVESEGENIAEAPA